MPLKTIAKTWGTKFQIAHCKSKKTGCTICSSLGYRCIILDCDKLKLELKISGKMCDCVFIEDRKTLYVGVIELKGISYGVSDVRSQLEAGIMLAKRILQKSQCQHYEIFHILVSKSFPDTVKAAALTSRPITVDGKKTGVLLARCGTRFSDIVKRRC